MGRRRGAVGPGLDETARLADQGRAFVDGLNASADQRQYDPDRGPLQQARPVITEHSRYGPPPGELRYTHSDDWTPEQTAEATQWLTNEMAKDWWRAQAVTALDPGRSSMAVPVR